MDEVRIWAIEDASTASAVVELKPRGQVETESLLEDTLVANPDLLIPGLKVVGRQVPTAGGPLDLLGVDGCGRLEPGFGPHERGQEVEEVGVQDHTCSPPVARRPSRRCTLACRLPRWQRLLRRSRCGTW